MARVLIVDHSSTELSKLKSLLEQLGHQVLSAENGADGVVLAREEQPDAVVMDILLPGLNGFQATRQLSMDAETTHIPVIITSNRDQETDEIWARRQGAKGYLLKPVAKERLAHLLTDLSSPELRAIAPQSAYGT